MSLAMIRKRYGLHRARRGQRVELDHECGRVFAGRIVSGDHRVLVRFETLRVTLAFDPTDHALRYVDEEPRPC